jgi:hypothetical protein
VSRAKHLRTGDWRTYLHPSRRRLAWALIGVIVGVTTFGVAALTARLRADIIRAGDCEPATVVGGKRSRLPIDRLTVALRDGTEVTLWGEGGDGVAVGDTDTVCRSSGGTRVDTMADSSNWLLSAEADVIAPVLGGMIIIVALFVGYDDPDAVVKAARVPDVS